LFHSSVFLSTALGGLPLALDQAGAYIEETKCGLAEYLRLYQAQYRKELLSRRGRFGNDHPASVVATFSLSFERVMQQSQEAVELLRTCAFLAADAIPETFFHEGRSAFAPSVSLPDNHPQPESQTKEKGFFSRAKAWFEPKAHKKSAGHGEIDSMKSGEAIGIVGAYSLIKRNVGNQTLSVHRLVQAVVRDGMNEGEQRVCAKRVVQWVADACPNIQNVEQWEACELWLPHALICARWIERYGLQQEGVGYLLNQAAVYLQERARYQEAAELFEQALRIDTVVYRPEHPNRATVLNNLADLARVRGRYEESELLHRQALAIREKQLGDQHLDVAQSLNTLALLYYEQKRYSEAEPLYQRALSIREKRLGETHPDVAIALNNLAQLYTAQARFDEAEPLHRRALAIREKQLRETHPDRAQSLNNLALLYKIQGKYPEALAIWEKQLGEIHPNVAVALNNLALLYQEQKRYSEAEPLHKRALAIREQQLGETHPTTAQSLNNLAGLYYAQGRWKEAEPLYERAVSIREQQLGETNLDTAQSWWWQAVVAEQRGKQEAARVGYERALGVYEPVLGKEHPDTKNLRGYYERCVQRLKATQKRKKHNRKRGTS